VLNNTGLPVGKAFVAYINNQYVRQGDIEVNKLFTIEDLTDTILEKQPFIEEEIKRLREILQDDTPDIPIGPYCDNPYECDFAAHCLEEVKVKRGPPSNKLTVV